MPALCATQKTYEEDISLRRVFDIHERLKFTFEARVFNLDNHTAFRGPNTSFGSNSFGTITSLGNAHHCTAVKC